MATLQLESSGVGGESGAAEGSTRWVGLESGWVDQGESERGDRRVVDAVGASDGDSGSDRVSRDQRSTGWLGMPDNEIKPPIHRSAAEAHGAEVSIDRKLSVASACESERKSNVLGRNAIDRINCNRQSHSSYWKSISVCIRR